MKENKSNIIIYLGKSIDSFLLYYLFIKFFNTFVNTYEPYYNDMNDMNDMNNPINAGNIQYIMKRIDSLQNIDK
jgi:hypothetical protein